MPKDDSKKWKDKASFIRFLTKFLEKRGMTLRTPRIGKKEMDLFVFFEEVQNRGGYEEVVENKQWLRIGAILGASGTSASHALRTNYEKFLLPLERSLAGREDEELETISNGTAARVSGRRSTSKDASEHKKRTPRTHSKTRPALDFGLSADRVQANVEFMLGCGDLVHVDPRPLEIPTIRLDKNESLPPHLSLGPNEENAIYKRIHCSLRMEGKETRAKSVEWALNTLGVLTNDPTMVYYVVNDGGEQEPSAAKVVQEFRPENVPSLVDDLFSLCEPIFWPKPNPPTAVVQPPPTDFSTSTETQPEISTSENQTNGEGVVKIEKGEEHLPPAGVETLFPTETPENEEDRSELPPAPQSTDMEIDQSQQNQEENSIEAEKNNETMGPPELAAENNETPNEEVIEKIDQTPPTNSGGEEKLEIEPANENLMKTSPERKSVEQDRELEPEVEVKVENQDGNPVQSPTVGNPEDQNADDSREREMNESLLDLNSSIESQVILVDSKRENEQHMEMDAEEKRNEGGEGAESGDDESIEVRLILADEEEEGEESSPFLTTEISEIDEKERQQDVLSSLQSSSQSKRGSRRGRAKKRKSDKMQTSPLPPAETSPTTTITDNNNNQSEPYSGKRRTGRPRKQHVEEQKVLAEPSDRWEFDKMTKYKSAKFEMVVEEAEQPLGLPGATETAQPLLSPITDECEGIDKEDLVCSVLRVVRNLSYDERRAKRTEIKDRARLVKENITGSGQNPPITTTDSDLTISIALSHNSRIASLLLVALQRNPARCRALEDEAARNASDRSERKDREMCSLIDQILGKPADSNDVGGVDLNSPSLVGENSFCVAIQEPNFDWTELAIDALRNLMGHANLPELCRTLQTFHPKFADDFVARVEECASAEQPLHVRVFAFKAVKSVLKEPLNHFTVCNRLSGSFLKELVRAATIPKKEIEPEPEVADSARGLFANFRRGVTATEDRNELAKVQKAALSALCQIAAVTNHDIRFKLASVDRTIQSLLSLISERTDVHASLPSAFASAVPGFPQGLAFSAPTTIDEFDSGIVSKAAHALERLAQEPRNLGLFKPVQDDLVVLAMSQTQEVCLALSGILQKL